MYGSQQLTLQAVMGRVVANCRASWRQLSCCQALLWSRLYAIASLSVRPPCLPSVFAVTGHCSKTGGAFCVCVWPCMVMVVVRGGH